MDIQINNDETLTDINDDLRLIQKKDGLTFGTDALLLAAFIKTQKKAIAADLGSGTGVISLLCAQRGKFAEIKAIEIQPEYADVIERNIKLNHLSHIISPVCRDIRNLEMTVDTAFSNPPFLKATGGKPSANEGRNAARHELNGDIGDFCAAAEKILKFGGLFYIVYRPDRLTDLIYALRKYHLEPKRLVFVYADITHVPCLLLIEAKKGAFPGLVTPRSFFLNIQGKISEEARTIYETGNWFI